MSVRALVVLGEVRLSSSSVTLPTAVAVEANGTAISIPVDGALGGHEVASATGALRRAELLHRADRRLAARAPDAGAQQRLGIGYSRPPTTVDPSARRAGADPTDLTPCEAAPLRRRRVTARGPAGGASSAATARKRSSYTSSRAREE